MESRLEHLLRILPSISDLLNDEHASRWVERHSCEQVKNALRIAVEQQRSLIIRERTLDDKFPIGEESRAASAETLRRNILGIAESVLTRQATPALRRVINATGVVLHTGLGRAPLGESALRAIQEAAGGYCNLEFDLESGKRGQRGSHIREWMSTLTGAESATVVNNNAAALLMILKTVAQPTRAHRKRNILVSRGQLVEIGGSFRLPEIMQAAGVALKEIGTTNRTRIEDYEAGIDDRTAALMRVHTSNYRIEGFAKSVGISDLVSLGCARGLPVIDDLGSGYLLEGQESGLDEPAVVRSVRAGADLVCFSGDKLLGGPQCGIVLGRKELIHAIDTHPLMRTYRVGKLTLLALEATLREMLNPERAMQSLPSIRLLMTPAEKIHERALRLAGELRKKVAQAEVEVIEDAALVGGGALPQHTIASWAVRIQLPDIQAQDLARALRRADPPIVARIHKDSVWLGCRTVFDEDVTLIVRAMDRAASGSR